VSIPQKHVHDPQAYAKELVEAYARNHLDKSDFEPFHIDVYVVWFSFTLGNWKALLSTTLLDGKYYEVTHNATKGETYLDCYVKLDNVAYPDEEQP
jgi:hypothetical protein